MKIIKLLESYPHSYPHSAADLIIGLILCGFDICCDDSLDVELMGFVR